jgi:formylglycine-generating enzyme required for sulfatase activity
VNNPKPKPKPKPDNLPRVYRGGSWFSTSATLVRAASRYDFTSSIRHYIFGFRCVLRGREPRV